VIVVLAGATGFRYGRGIWVPVYQKVVGKRTVSDVLEEFGPPARATWSARLAEKGLSYPPRTVDLVAIKKDRVLQVWTHEGNNAVLLYAYPILEASGTLGPKLREGDRQVPEGVYAIEGLNPNSAFHLSMKVNYPNAFDRERAQEDGRTELGGDIFIHRKQASIGCLAMGDAAIEELFVLVADVGVGNARVVISPVDYRKDEAFSGEDGPRWLPELYGRIRDSILGYV